MEPYFIDKVKAIGAVGLRGEEAELFSVLDLIVVEFEADPTSAECFDSCVVDRAKKITAVYRTALSKFQAKKRH